MNALVPQNFGTLSTVFQGTLVEDDLSAGVQAGFGIVGYKGKVWSIRYRGEERQLMRDDGDGPRNSIEVVLVDSSKTISKIWYEAGYVEGSTASPDCFSTNGVTPDPQSARPQCATCAACPKNAWGSRITPAGKPGKACSDSKRVVVVPLGDIKNEVFGGPLLLRVPAASLQDLAQFGKAMSSLGYPYFAIGTRIAFDAAEAYPKFQFNAIRPLNDVEAQMVKELREDPAVRRILAEDMGSAPTQPQAPLNVQSAFEQPPQVAPTPQPVQQAAPQQAAPVQQAQQAQQVAPPAPQAAPKPTQTVSGFGAMAPVQQETPQPVQQAQTVQQFAAQVESAADGAMPDEPAPTGSSFEKGLDDMLNNLLKPDA